MNDQEMKKLFKDVKSIAIVGLSPKKERPSNRVARYLMDAGYTVIPVNPGQTEILGLPCYPDLSSIGRTVDLVDIFRRSEDVGSIVEEALALSPRPKGIWMQLGVVNDEAAQMARQSGVAVVMNRCTKIEHEKLLQGEFGRREELK